MKSRTKQTSQKKINGNGHSRKFLMNEAAETILYQRQQLVSNLMTSRTEWLQRNLQGKKDIDYECDYPASVTIDDYCRIYKRFGLARRVVSIFPEECWRSRVEIYEDEDHEVETAFEKRLAEIEEKHSLLSYMKRVDIMSGKGRFGILLLGISDGRPLDRPVEGTNSKGERIGTKQLDLIYIKSYDESKVKILDWEKDPTNPRWGWPTMYEVAFSIPNQDGTNVVEKKKVHWHRVVHIADNCESSEVFGSPRMEGVYNTLLDLKKVYGSAAEGYWKGAFPGITFKVDPNVEDPEMDVDSIKEEFELYANSLQRYMAIEGVEIDQLEPQIEDPTNHLTAGLNFITMVIGCPLRVFMGSEAAHLASDEDKITWRERVQGRNHEYLTPRVVRRIIDHLIMVGVVPKVKKYFVYWPDINTSSEMDKATRAKVLTEAISKYVATGAARLIAPTEFFINILGFPREEVKVIIEKLKKSQAEVKKMGLVQDAMEMSTRRNAIGPRDQRNATRAGSSSRIKARPNGRLTAPK